MSVSGAREYSREEFEYDHPEVLEGEPAVSEGAESEAAAIEAESAVRRPAVPKENFNTWHTNNVKFFRDGGTAILEGLFNRTWSGTIRFDGALNSATRGEVFLTRKHFMRPAEPERSLTAEERKSLIKALEREIAQGSPIAGDLKLVVDRLKAFAPKPGVTDLGLLEEPGKELKKKTFELKPGETLRFATYESAVRGLGEIKIDPPGALLLKRKALEPVNSTPGGSTLFEYTFSVPRGAQPDTLTVTTSGAFQVRDDPDWAFSFNVKVGPK